MARKIKNDVISDSMAVLDRLYGKSDIYGEGMDGIDSQYTDEVKAVKTLKESGFSYPSLNEDETEDEDGAFSDMIPDYEEEGEDMDELGDEGVTPEDVEFLEGVSVYKVKNLDTMTEEELEEFKALVDEQVSNLDFELNYKWIEAEAEDYSDEEVSDDDLEGEDGMGDIDDVDAIEEAMNEEEGEDVEPLEAEEVEIDGEGDEEIVESTEGMDVYLVIYDNDLLSEESDSDDVLEFTNYLDDNFEEIDINSEDYAFVKEEIIMSDEDEEGSEEEIPTEETPEEEPEEEPVVEESTEETAEVIDESDEKDEREEDEEEEEESLEECDSSKKEEEEELEESLKDKIKRKIKEKMSLSEKMPGGGTGGDGGNGGDGGTGAGSSNAEESTMTTGLQESALEKAKKKLQAIKEAKENNPVTVAKKKLQAIKEAKENNPVTVAKRKLAEKKKIQDKKVKLSEKMTEVKSKIKMNEKKKAERLAALQEKIDAKKSSKKESVEPKTHKSEVSLAESIREKLARIKKEEKDV